MLNLTPTNLPPISRPRKSSERQKTELNTYVMLTFKNILFLTFIKELIGFTSIGNVGSHFSLTSFQCGEGLHW